MGLWDSFTGSAGKKQAAATLAANNATAQGGYDANKGYLAQGYNAATSKLQPSSNSVLMISWSELAFIA